MNKNTGMIIAATVGALFATASMAAEPTGSDANGSVKCVGGNSCKGQSVCRAAGNSCRGQNSCKGKGMSMAKDAKDCKNMGGHVDTEKK